MAGKIIFNGREYETLDAMSPEDRRLYDAAVSALDKDSDGTPDFLQHGPPARIVIDGKRYSSLEEVPPHMRALVQQVVAEATQDSHYFQTPAIEETGAKIGIETSTTIDLLHVPSPASPSRRPHTLEEMERAQKRLLVIAEVVFALVALGALVTLALTLFR